MAQAEQPLFSNGDLFSLIWPLIVERLLTITVGMFDIMMVSSLGEAAVSGVSLVDNIQLLIENLFAALSAGGVVVCSQYMGKGRPDLSSKAARQLIYTVVLLAAGLGALGLAGRGALLPLVFGKIEADVMSEAQTYFVVMMFALLPMGIYNVCAALFRAQGNSRISMYTAALINVLNVCGNYIGIFVLGLGVFGAAVATLFSRMAAATILYAMLYRGKPGASGGAAAASAVSIRGILKVQLDPRLIKSILGIGIPNGIENSMFQLGKIVVLSLIATFGTGAIAANAAANTMIAFNVLPGMSIGLAMLTVIGRCAGAGRLEEAKAFAWKLVRVTYACMLVVDTTLLIFGRRILSVYNLQSENAELAWRMLFCHGFSGIFIWPLAFTLPNALRALNDAKFTMIASMLSMWIVRVGFSYILAWTTRLGPLSVWIAMVADWVARAVVFTVRFRREKWKAKAML